MGSYLYVFCTIIFTVYGQIILKWRLNNLQISLPDSLLKKGIYLTKLVFDPYIFSGFLSAFIASLFWMIAMTKLELTTAYPFMSIAPRLVFIVGVFLLGETFTLGKLIGLVLIILGTVVTVKF